MTEIEGKSYNEITVEDLARDIREIFEEAQKNALKVLEKCKSNPQLFERIKLSLKITRDSVKRLNDEMIALLNP